MINRLRLAVSNLASEGQEFFSDNNSRPRRTPTVSTGVGRRGGYNVEHLQRVDSESSRLPYSRPHFLGLNHDEVTASADQTARPIILPRDVTKIPWCAGYAEIINAGKSEVNEDQARAERIVLRNNLPVGDNFEVIGLNDKEEDEPVSMIYFGIFDGHAGYGAAVMAASSLHYIITDRLLSIMELLLSKFPTTNGKKTGANNDNANQTITTTPVTYGKLNDCCVCHCHRQQTKQKSRAPVSDMAYTPSSFDRTNDIKIDELVIGAIEKAFIEMDNAIDGARKRFNDTLGGCAALVAIFFMGKLYVANAGDCRAVICRDGKAVPVSFDFTPETERRRIQMMATLQPFLLHNEFTPLEFARRPSRKDLGKMIPYKEPWMSGWSLKTITDDDLKFPLINGEGKRARLLATIGVTRGFGDHSLKVYDSDIKIKPFLSSVPDIKVIDMNGCCHTENDVLIMASDGLWDVISSDQATVIVHNSLSSVEVSNQKRYTLAAQDLLMSARGTQQGQWKTVDDVTVFVIPLHFYSNNNSSQSEEDSDDGHPQVNS